MNTSQSEHPIAYRPLQLGLPGALLVYMMLLLHVSFGGAVAPIVWWLVLLLPISAALAQFATRRILWRQMSYIVTAGAMTLAACVSATSVTAAIAPNPGLIVAALALSVVLVGLWAYRWAKQHVATGRSGLVTRVNARPRSTEAQIVVTRRRWSIHNTSLFAKILTFSVIVSGAVKLMSLQGKMAMLSVSAWLFAWLGALAVGHALYVLRLTRVWERKHGAPLIEANRSDKSEER